MTRIYVFVAGISIPVRGRTLWTSCALTDQGRWLAGAVSALGKDAANERCQNMTNYKAPSMLTGAFETIVTELTDKRVQDALNEALKRMP